MWAMLWLAAAQAGDRCDAAAMTVQGKRTRVGGAVEVLAHERVTAVTVVAGSARIDGTVYGAVTVVGGRVTLGPCATVYGSVTALGGRTEAAPTAIVHGGRTGLGG